MIWPLTAAMQRYAGPLLVALAIGAAYVYHRVELKGARKDGYDAATTEMATRIATANAATAALEQRLRAQSDAAAAAWEIDRNVLQSQVDQLLSRKPVVRLCKPASSAVPVSSSTEPAAGSNDAAVGAIDAVQAQRDIGGELVRYAGECERYRQQLISLQGWLRETHQAAAE